MSRNNELEIYIHIPFCANKCRYCDFVSFYAEESAQEAYTYAVINEINSFFFNLEDYDVRSVYIGGGTPSFVKPELIRKILSELQNQCCFRKDTEITIEANPCSISKKKLDIYLESGVNRISIGCQSLNNSLLKVLGRIHDYETFIKAYDLVDSSGFKNVNVDLIYGIPGQNVDDFAHDLDMVSSLHVNHISAYALTLEAGTPLFEKKDDLAFPTEDEIAGMFFSAGRILDGKGFFRYEISNYSKKGFESVHNIGYWTGVPYIGFGLNASSFFMNKRWRNTSDFKKYLDEAKSSGIKETIHELSARELCDEFMMLGLRLVKGVSVNEFKRKFQKDIFDVYNKALRKNLKRGTLISDGERLYIPEKYLFVSNQILVDFIDG